MVDKNLEIRPNDSTESVGEKKHNETRPMRAICIIRWTVRVYKVTFGRLFFSSLKRIELYMPLRYTV